MIQGVRIPLPPKTSAFIIKVAVFLHLIDPLELAPTLPAAKAPSPPPVVPQDSPNGIKPSLRNRSESTIGLESAQEAEAAGNVKADASTEDKRLHIVIDLRTAPLIGVILLLATTTIDGSVLRQGLGDETAKPYDVLVLFISLASDVLELW